MRLSPGLFRRWRALTERVRDGSGLDQADRLEAAALLQKLPARRVVKAMKRERLAKEADVKAARRNRVAKLRAEVFEHWLGDCAVCLAAHRKVQATDMHHVLSGPLRRLRESKATLLPVCGDHHRLLHRNDLDALLSARLVCEVEGMNEAADALDRRIAKVNEARAAQGRP